MENGEGDTKKNEAGVSSMPRSVKAGETAGTQEVSKGDQAVANGRSNSKEGLDMWSNMQEGGLVKALKAFQKNYPSEMGQYSCHHTSQIRSIMRLKVCRAEGKLPIQKG